MTKELSYFSYLLDEIESNDDILEIEYEDALEEAKQTQVGKWQAVQVIDDHCCDLSEFFEECGEREVYNGADILTWLGY